MADASCRGRLHVKAGEKLRIIQELPLQKLQGDWTITDTDLLSQKHRSHTARTQRPEDTVLLGQAWQTLRRRPLGRRRQCCAITGTKFRVVRKRSLALEAGAHRPVSFAGADP